MASDPGYLSPHGSEGNDLILYEKPILEREIVHGKEDKNDQPVRQRVNQTAVQSDSDATATRTDALHVSAATDVSKIPVETLLSPGPDSAICLQTNSSNPVTDASPARASVFRTSEADQTLPCVSNTATSVTGRDYAEVEKYELNEDARSTAPKEKLEKSAEYVNATAAGASSRELSNVKKEETNNPTFTMVEPGKEKSMEGKKTVCVEDLDIGRALPDGSPASTAPSSAYNYSDGSQDSQVSNPHMSDDNDLLAELRKDTDAKSARNGQEATVCFIVVLLACMILKQPFCEKARVTSSLAKTSKKKQTKKQKILSVVDLIASWPAIKGEKSHFKSASWTLEVQFFQSVLVYMIFPYNFQIRCRDDLMSMESMRLSTFINYPHALHHSALRLANAGFFYTGQGDMLACYRCGITVVWDWHSQVQDPYMVHRHRNPFCPHLSASGQTNFIQDDQHRAQSSRDITSGAALPPIRQSPDPRQGGDAAARSAVVIPNDDVDLRHKTYDKRLRTFQNWPRDHPTSPQELAEAGFFYAGQGDQVRCFSCGLAWCGWRRGDCPLEVHVQILNPRCAFLRRHYGTVVIRRILLRGRLSPRSARHSPQPARFVCNVCMLVVVTIVFLPCGHTICHLCSARVQQCHMCRGAIQQRVTIRFAPQHPVDNRRAEAYHQAHLFISLHVRLPPTIWARVLHDYGLSISEAIVDDMILVCFPEDARHFQPNHDILPRSMVLLISRQESRRLQPWYPDMRHSDSRLGTFQRLGRLGNSAALDSLAHAGFFYRGEMMVCFHCGFGSVNWRDSTDLMARHRRISPHCSNVRRILGRRRRYSE